MKEVILVSDIETGRLKKLAEHLKKRNLLEKVDRESTRPKLRVYESSSPIRYLDFPFAECTHIFDEWGFNPDGQPTLNEISQCSAAVSAMEFFNVDEYVFQHLFSPELQDCKMFGGKVLSRNATAREISYNILCFLNKLQELN